jgi:molecular chaperone HtpG
MSYLHVCEGKLFRSVAKGDIDLAAIETAAEKPGENDSAEAASIDSDLLKRVADQLTEQVSAVRSSQRLTDSASCLVLNEHDMALHLQKMLKQAGRAIPESKPILELNPAHPLMARLASEGDAERFGMLSLLLYEQALLPEGGSLPDPAGFVRRINTLMTVVPDST